MTHRQIQPGPRRPLFPRVTVRHLKVTSGVLSLVLAGLAGGIAYTSSTDTDPSPTLAIETPARPGEPDYRDGGLLSVAPTPRPVPPVQPQSVPEPAVVYETDGEPVPVYIPPPSPPTVVLTVPPQPSATVVREVPVPVPVEQPRREHKRDRKQERPKTSATSVPDEDETREVCVGQWICVSGERKTDNESRDTKKDDTNDH